MNKLVPFTVVALVLCIASQLGQAAEPGTAGPERTIHEFYSWYVRTVVSGSDPLTKQRTELKRFATDRLIREIDGMRKGPDGLDGDYFLDAQDFDKAWAKNITIAAPVITGTKATTDVELKGPEVGSKKLRVTLAQENGAWKVDKVEGRQ